MSEQLTLPAEARDRAGKGASRALRRDGRVPAVVYGEKKEPLSIHVEEKLLTKMLQTGHFMNSVVMIDVGGKADPDACPRRSTSIRSPAARSTSISCASASTPRSPSRCRCASTMKKPRRASSAAACSTSSSTSSSWSATRRTSRARSTSPRRARDRRFDPHQPGQAARGRQAGDRRPRLHRRHHRRPVGDEGRGRRSRAAEGEVPTVGEEEAEGEGEGEAEGAAEGGEEA